MKKLLNKKGFTIVELVIVIAVIGILAAVLIPTFSNVIESANKTADLQEAQSTLKAYTAFMGSKGSTLSDGTVFEVKKSNDQVSSRFVYYKGQLHEFILTESNGLNAGLTKPAVQIGDTKYACDKFFNQFDENENGKADDTLLKDGEKNITFFYATTATVTFEDGSLKCSIKPGVVVSLNDVFTNETVDDDLNSDLSWQAISKYPTQG